MSTRGKKILSIAIKISAILLVIWFVYRKLSNNENLREFKEIMRGLGPDVVYRTITVLFLLMMLNWLLECIKWRYLCKPIQTISYYKAFESVFCGLSWAIFTPNRIGEYGGRVLFLKPRKRIFGVIAMAVGAFAQLVITNVLGGLALIWFLATYQDLPIGLFLLSVSLIVFFIGLMVLLYFKIRIINKFIGTIKWLSRTKRFFNLLERYSTQELLHVFLLSLARFAVFSSQYAFIMQTLLPDLPFVPMVLMVFLLFFIQSAVPSLDLIDVGVRSLTAGYLFAFITQQELAVMASAASIWFINLIVPAIIGSVFIFKINFFGHSGN